MWTTPWNQVYAYTMKNDKFREFTDDEVLRLRALLYQLSQAKDRNDILGRWAEGQTQILPIPLLMWADGHGLT